MSIERRVVAFILVSLIGSAVGAAVAGAVGSHFEIASLGLAVGGVVLGNVAAWVVLRERVAGALPSELDGWFDRRPRLRWLWLVAAVLAVVNTARVGVFVADSSQVWASAFPIVPESAEHQCLAAYVRAGELAAQGQPDLWRDDDYADTTAIVGMHPYLGDPYEYPPTFAVVPRAVVAVTNDYGVIRALWFGISALGFWLAFLALGTWVGGRTGATALLLAPPLALSFPLVLALQFGQAHVLVVAASVAAMVCFARGRVSLGAVLLGAAVATKIFPGLLLVHLAMRRQWRAIAATLVAIAVLVAIAAAVLGPATLGSFVTDQVPRMASGEAFSYSEENPDNNSLFGVAFKLRALGIVDADRSVGSLLAMLWAVVAVVLVALASRAGAHRAHDATLWLATVCLAQLQSPFAPAYTSISTLWLLALVPGATRPRRWLIALVAVAWVLLQGAPPMGSEAASVIASLPAQVTAIVAAVAAAWPRRAAG